jgi:hypothetical protein
MSITVKSKTVDVQIEIDRDEVDGHVIPLDMKHEETEKIMRMHYSLMGETKPRLSPLFSEFSTDEKMATYRYDWSVGLTLIDPCYLWNWMKTIREKRAMAVQLLINCGDSGYSFTELSAVLLTLQPSLEGSSLYDKYADKIGDSLAKISEITQPFNQTAAGVFRLTAVMSNLISSGEKNNKKWFIYRFLDEKKKCCAIEWNINRNVFENYGPLLRGSLILNFHGTKNTGSKGSIEMLLRPRLGFARPEIAYLPPESELEDKDPVALTIAPIENSAEM